MHTRNVEHKFALRFNRANRRTIGMKLVKTRTTVPLFQFSQPTGKSDRLRVETTSHMAA